MEPAQSPGRRSDDPADRRTLAGALAASGYPAARCTHAGPEDAADDRLPPRSPTGPSMAAPTAELPAAAPPDPPTNAPFSRAVSPAHPVVARATRRTRISWRRAPFPDPPMVVLHYESRALTIVFSREGMIGFSRNCETRIPSASARAVSTSWALTTMRQMAALYARRMRARSHPVMFTP